MLKVRLSGLCTLEREGSLPRCPHALSTRAGDSFRLRLGRCTRQLALSAKEVIPYNQQQEPWDFDEDPLPFPPGIVDKAVDELKAQFAQPEGCAGPDPGEEVEEPADSHADTRLKSILVPCNPLFLKRRAHRYQQNIGTSRIDLFDDPLFLSTCKKTGMQANDPRTQIPVLDIPAALLHYLSTRTEQVDAPPFVGCKPQNARREIRPVQVLFDGVPVQASRNRQSCPVWQCKIRTVDNLLEGRVIPTQKHRMDVDEHNRFRPARWLLHEFGNALQSSNPGDVVKGHAERTAPLPGLS